MELFKCSKCKREYPWFMQGGTGKMIANPIQYALGHVTECAYCVGKYPDGTACYQNKN